MHFLATGGAGGALAAGGDGGGPASASASSPHASSAAAALELSSLLPAGWEERGGPLMRTAGTLLSNPFFSAGAGLWLLNFGGKIGARGVKLAQELFERRFRLSMEVNNTDSGFTWLLEWLAKQENFRTHRLSVSARVNYRDGRRQDGTCVFAPAIGVKHYFFVRGWPVTLTRTRNEQRNMDGEIFESLTLSTYGFNTSIFTSMMEEAQAMAMAEEAGKTAVLINRGGYWGQSGARRSRPLSSVVLPAATSERIVADVRQFLRSEEYYRELGVPYRRGYLLHGPPGCGKTSFVTALAGELGLSISLLSLSNRSLTDESLLTLMNSVQAGTLVLMEDIDRAFSAGGSVTMSGLLNALDGVSAQEGGVVFMTTNHVEKLDAALIRPGRVDVKVEIGRMSADEAGRLFAKFFPDAPPELVRRFGSQLPPNLLSAAELQSHLFFHRDDPEAAVATLPAFIAATCSFDQRIGRARAVSETETEGETGEGGEATPERGAGGDGSRGSRDAADTASAGKSGGTSKTASAAATKGKQQEETETRKNGTTKDGNEEAAKREDIGDLQAAIRNLPRPPIL